MPSLDPYITDVLMRDLVGHDRRPVSFLVYLWLAVEQEQKSAAVQISYKALAESVGVSKSSVQSAVAWLVRRRLIAASKASATATPSYSVLSPWKDLTTFGQEPRCVIFVILNSLPSKFQPKAESVDQGQVCKFALHPTAFIIGRRAVAIVPPCFLPGR